MTSRKQKVALIYLGIFLAFVLCEIALRIAGVVLITLQEHRNRISLRTEEVYRILCLGESTTALGGKISYPSQLERILNQSNIGLKFKVINKGISGTSTTVILGNLEQNINAYKPHMIITMMGINDRVNPFDYEDGPFKGMRDFLKRLKIFKVTEMIYTHILYIIEERRMGIPEIKKQLVLKRREAGLWKNSKAKEIFLKKAIAKDPDNETAYMDLAFYYLIHDKRNEAHEVFNAVLRINPENYIAYTELYNCYRVGGKFYNIEKMLKKAIANYPRDYEAYLRLANCYIDNENPIEAEAVFKRAIEINPKEADGYADLAKLYRYNFGPEKAEALLKNAVAFHVENDEIYLGLGKYLRMQGKLDEAHEALKKAITYNPENEEILEEFLTLLYMKVAKVRMDNRAVRTDTYYSGTMKNYRKLKEIVLSKAIKLVCVQYPNLNLKPLYRIFEDPQGMIFVDSERIFNDAIAEEGFDEYFIDSFASFDGRQSGHCTDKGNRLLAENIAQAILREILPRQTNPVELPTSSGLSASASDRN